MRFRKRSQPESPSHDPSEDEPLIPEQAQQWLTERGIDPTVGGLVEALGGDDPKTTLMSYQTLEGLGEEAARALVGGLQAGNSKVRGYAALLLGMVGATDAADPLLAALNDEDEGVRSGAAGALVRFRDSRVFEFLTSSVTGAGPIPRHRAIELLGQLGDARAADALLTALGDPEAEVRESAAAALGHLSDGRIGEALATALGDESPDVRWAAAKSLAAHDDVRGDEVLLNALREGDAGKRWSVVSTLGQLAKPRFAEPLTAALGDQNADVRKEAAAALEHIEAPQSGGA